VHDRDLLHGRIVGESKYTVWIYESSIAAESIDSIPIGSNYMNLSEIFIRRPVMTTLVMLAILIFGLMSYVALPIAALPNVDYPFISVSASLPGGNPETMASAVATPLERQFTEIVGLNSFNSTSATGSTNISLQFDFSRSVASAANSVDSGFDR
jgi:hydrophobic/amphiphilic exporter-1 (mainly G- bacteria), HAE1 family